MNRRCFNALAVLSFLLSLLLVAGCGSESSTGPDNDDDDDNGDPAGSRIWYVNADATGTGSGDRWENAFLHPSEAMDSASAGDQIWVALADYFGPGDRREPVVAFKAGVKLYGEFDGDETDLSQRNFHYRATFDGGDSLYHVVTGADDALLDGINVTNGRALNPSDPTEMRGAGIYCLNDRMRVANCAIFENEAFLGGGIYSEGDTVVIDSCSFVSNVSHEIDLDESAGGGGVNICTGRAVLDRCSFGGNDSRNNGGGMLLYNSSAHISNSFIDQNSLSGTGADGGAVYIYNADVPELEIEFVGCRIADNSAPRGAGIAADQAKIGFTNCIFNLNEATTAGSALHLNNCSYVMEHCILWGNGASTLLSVYHAGAGIPRIFNCIFQSNGNNERDGGAIYAIGTLELDFCTITNNIAGEGAGIYSTMPGSMVSVSNSIVWNNQSMIGPHHIQAVNSAVVYLTYTDIDQDGYTGNGNLRSNPLFIISGLGGGGRYFLSHIAAGQDHDSPCIDMGNDTAESYGLNGRTTRLDRVVDEGWADLGFHYDPSY